MLVTLGPGAMISDLNHLCYHLIIHVIDQILQVIVTYYMLLSSNPGVTIVGTTPGDDRSLRSDTTPSYLLFQTLLPLFWTLTCMI